MYKINDLVVYRREVCRVVGKQKSDFTGEKCYVLVPYYQDDGSTRMQVPVANKGGHLRDLVSRQEIAMLIKETPDIELLASKPANMKSQYAALIKSDSLQDLVCIIKTSYARNKERLDQNKKLTSIDDEYMQKAEQYLYNELSLALGMSFEEAKDYFAEEVRKVWK